MTLRQAIADRTRRPLIATDAVRSAEVAIRSRRGIAGVVVAAGFETIQRVRPGFLVRQVEEMLPAMADALDPFWSKGRAHGDGVAFLTEQAPAVAEALLRVTDAQAEASGDRVALAVYERLRPHGPKRIVEHIRHIAWFMVRHAVAY